MGRDKITSPKELLKEWIDAFNKHHVEALINLYHVDAVNYQVAAGEPVVGIEKIKDDFLSVFKAFPDVYAEVENIMEDGQWAAWEWKGGGTFQGEFLGFKPNGNSFELRGCGFFQFRGNKIILQRGYWDKLTWFSQIGIYP